MWPFGRPGQEETHALRKSRGDFSGSILVVPDPGNRAASEAKLALEPVSIYNLHQPRDAEALRAA
jgi:hypothetical protein